MDGGYFEYPHGVFVSGLIAGRVVGCLSASQQRHFHTGYEHRPQDVHDLAQLDKLDANP
jgi:lincosamide nucleotidyltransferase A/C/D/E